LPRSIRSEIRIALLVLGGLIAAGCRPRPTAGDKCKVADQVACTSRDRALVCEGPGGGDARTWTEVSCKGARGCARTSDEDECDDTLAAEGDPCPSTPPLDYACSSDLSSALACHDGRFDLWRRCRGPQGCKIVDGRNVHCDTSLGEAGDPCERSGTFACSVDGRSMLACDGKTLSVVSACRGPKACWFDKGEPGAEPHKINCDDGLADEGDLCTQARRITCALDHKAELVCDGHKFAKKRECRRSDCRIDGTELFCD
jgi:hypothetical protein